MDKNKFWGILLLSLLLVFYTYFFDSRPVPPPATNVVQQPTVLVDPLAIKNEFWSPFMQGVEQEIALENDNLSIILTSRGAKVKKVFLKKFLDHKGQQLELVDERSNQLGFEFKDEAYTINTNQLFFQVSDDLRSAGDTSPDQITFLLPIGPNQYIKQIFSLNKASYELTQTWEFVGLVPHIKERKLEFVWQNAIKRVEKDIEACRNRTTINYGLADKSFNSLKEQSDTIEQKTINHPLEWVAFKQRFFTAAVLAQSSPFLAADCQLQPTIYPQQIVKEGLVRLTLPVLEQNSTSGIFKFYFGPNAYQDLKHFWPGFSKNLPLGWPIVKWINQCLIIPVFDWIIKYVTNYGLAIVLLVLFIKLLIFPLSYKSYIAMAEMKIVKPALDLIKERYGNDVQKVQMEQLQLYREMGINPLSGFIPVLLQMPILLAMFNFFPNAIELRQKPFLWATDLSTYDAVIHLPFKVPFYGSHVSLFTLLMTASTILYTWSTNQGSMPKGPMKVMSYLFPLMFMLILNSLPAGLSFYYFISNLITFGQQMAIKRFVDEDRLKKKLEENKNKIKNKGIPFKQRLQGVIKNYSQNKPSK